MILKNDIEIQRCISERDENLQPVKTWYVLSNVKGDMQSQAGDVRYNRNKDEIITTHKLFIKPTDVTSQDRIVFQNIIYNITFINRLNNHYEIDLKVIDEQTDME